MKQSKLVIILLVVLMVCGWAMALLATDNDVSSEYQGHLELAADYMDRGLYQKAIEEYDAAIAIEDSEDLWDLKLDAYAKRYEESSKIYSDYLSVAQAAVSIYSTNVDFLLTLVDLYLNDHEYTSAYSAITKAIDTGMSNEQINEKLLEVKYSYEIPWKSFIEYRTCVNGYYAVSETGVWTYIEEDGTGTDFTKLTFAGPVGDSGIRVIQNDNRVELIDSEEVVQGILSFTPVDVGVYSEGLIAIRNETGYSYYNSLGDKQFGEYDYAGTFVNGIAAVRLGESWFLIDQHGTKTSNETYEDIILHANGSHAYNGVMIAKQNGAYSFYKDGERIGSYSEVDIITDDEVVAVCTNEKWGFVDLEGNEIITPKFEAAESFSNGLAAVNNGEYWGFINLDGVLVIDYRFLDTDYFNSAGTCMVETTTGVWQLLSRNIKE